jgi:hypothetical protein
MLTGCALVNDLVRYLTGWYSTRVNGGDTVSTEAVAARRHAGRHLPVIG